MKELDELDNQVEEEVEKLRLRNIGLRAEVRMACGLVSHFAFLLGYEEFPWTRSYLSVIWRCSADAEVGVEDQEEGATRGGLAPH